MKGRAEGRKEGKTGEGRNLGMEHPSDGGRAGERHHVHLCFRGVKAKYICKRKI
jgi:hypothetical protein